MWSIPLRPPSRDLAAACALALTASAGSPLAAAATLATSRCMSSHQPRCPDPAGSLNELPKALWPLASWHAELAETGALAEARAALKWYTEARAANYRGLNRQLRSGAESESAQKKVELLDTLLRESPRLEAPGLTLWRGMSSMAYVGWVVDQRAKVVTDRAYMSCTLSRSTGNFYARRHAVLPEDLEDALLLRIQVPAGAAVLCVTCDGEAREQGEEEILLPRNSTLRIERVEPRDADANAGSIHLVEARLEL